MPQGTGAPRRSALVDFWSSWGKGPQDRIALVNCFPPKFFLKPQSNRKVLTSFLFFIHLIWVLGNTCWCSGFRVHAQESLLVVLVTICGIETASGSAMCKAISVLSGPSTLVLSYREQGNQIMPNPSSSCPRRTVPCSSILFALESCTIFTLPHPVLGAPLLKLFPSGSLYLNFTALFLSSSYKRSWNNICISGFSSGIYSLTPFSSVQTLYHALKITA